MESAFIAKLLNVSLVHRASAFCLNQFIDLQLLHDCLWFLTSFALWAFKATIIAGRNSWTPTHGTASRWLECCKKAWNGLKWHLCLQLLANPDWDNEWCWSTIRLSSKNLNVQTLWFASKSSPKEVGRTSDKVSTASRYFPWMAHSANKALNYRSCTSIRVWISLKFLI